MENDEKKYEDVIKALKGLQQVKAPENFEADLQRRINSEKFSKKEKKGFWQNIFVPAKLIPSLGLVAAAVVIFFVVETNSEEMDNPFLIEPRVREDIFEVIDYEEFKQEQQKELPKAKSLEKETQIPKERTDKNELKSSGEEKVFGRKKVETADKFFEEKDFARDQSVTEGILSVPESTHANVTVGPQPTVFAKSRLDSTAMQMVTKEELNFRQVQLSTEEQKVVDELKNQVQSLDKINKTQK